MHHPVDPDVRTCRANPASYHRFRPKSGKQLCFHCWNKLSCTANPILSPLLGRGFDKMRPELTIRVRLVHAAPNLRTLDSVTSCANGAAAWGFTGPRKYLSAQDFSVHGQIDSGAYGSTPRRSCRLPLGIQSSLLIVCDANAKLRASYKVCCHRAVPGGPRDAVPASLSLRISRVDLRARRRADQRNRYRRRPGIFSRRNCAET